MKKIVILHNVKDRSDAIGLAMDRGSPLQHADAGLSIV